MPMLAMGLLAAVLVGLAWSHWGSDTGEAGGSTGAWLEAAAEAAAEPATDPYMPGLFK